MSRAWRYEAEAAYEIIDVLVAALKKTQRALRQEIFAQQPIDEAIRNALKKARVDAD
jgi:hypothetical protein